MRCTTGAALLLLCSALAAAAAPPGPDGPPAAGAGVLRFVRDGREVRSIGLAALRRECGERTVRIDDPYYGKVKTYRACPLAEVLRLGFGARATELAAADVVFRAADGYAKPAPGARLAEDGGWLAFSDADLDRGGAPAWAPIDRRQVDPGPFYLVWANPGQRDAHRYPWPYELVEIEIASLGERWPHTVPVGSPPGSPARAGYEIFKSECVACHSVNGEGGRIGPDLNVPRSIVEYRPEEQIRAYVRDPRQFRYGNMPSHEHLGERELDELVAYLRAMSRLKHDPGPPS